MRAFKRAYASTCLTGQLIGLDINPLAPALREVDLPYIVPRLTAADYIPTLINICQKHQVDLIFPLIDYDMPVLARHRAEIEATGARLNVVSEAAVEIAADKWQTTQFFQNNQVPTPRSWLPEQIDAAAVEFPLFIKPRRGSASQHTFKVSNQRELAFFRDYIKEPIIQEYLPGPEITNDVISDLNGKVLAVVSRQRVEVRSGEVNKGVTIFDPQITALCERVAMALPACGPITVQCMMRDGRPFFTEINARLGGGIPLGIAAGVNSPELLLRSAAGEAVSPLLPGDYEQGLYLSRFDDSFFISESQRQEMELNRFHD